MDGRGARGPLAEARDAPTPADEPASTPATRPASIAGAATTGTKGAQRRAYDASGRRAAAERRRAHVVATASRLFPEHGWTGTTIAGVAREAGVSPEYVSKTFGAKQALLMLAMRSASFAGTASLSESFAALRLAEEPDPSVRLDRFVEFVCASVVPMAPFVPSMVQGASEDLGMRTLLQGARRGHVDVVTEVVPLLAIGPVHPDAIDEIVVLTRSETYLVLSGELGWSVERYAAWLRRRIARAVDLTG